MKLDGVVFYGRLGQLALQMYGLDQDLTAWKGKPVLDCPGGPSSLVALLATAGIDAIACDPLYALSNAELRERTISDLDLSIAKSATSTMLRPGCAISITNASAGSRPARFRSGGPPAGAPVMVGCSAWFW